MATLAVVGIVATVALFAVSTMPTSGMNLMSEGDYEFIRFVAKHGKSYSSKSDFEGRGLIFKQNMAHIKLRNSHPGITY